MNIIGDEYSSTYYDYYRGDEATWGISICRDQPLICVSSNAHTVNIFNLDSVNLYKDKITVTVSNTCIVITIVLVVNTTL